MINSLVSDEIKWELRSAKNAERLQQKFKFSLKQQALQHPVQKEHLSIQLLEIIQTILFMMIWCRAPNQPKCLYYFTNKALYLKFVYKSIPICILN